MEKRLIERALNHREVKEIKSAAGFPNSTHLININFQTKITESLVKPDLSQGTGLQQLTGLLLTKGN
jgi:hypothetical protein